MRVTFLCSANQCRSAMAEGVLKAHAKGAAFLEVDSAGVARYGDGAPATPQTRRVSAKNGVDVSRHRSREATPQILRRSDLIIGMTGKHLQLAAEVDPTIKPKLFTLTQIGRLLNELPYEIGPDELASVLRDAADRSSVNDPDVPDPVVEPDVITYDDAFAVIESNVTRLAAALGLDVGRTRSADMGRELYTAALARAGPSDTAGTALDDIFDADMSTCDPNRRSTVDRKSRTAA